MKFFIRALVSTIAFLTIKYATLYYDVKCLLFLSVLANNKSAKELKSNDFLFYN